MIKESLHFTLLPLLLVLAAAGPVSAQSSPQQALTRAQDITVTRTATGFALNGTLETTNGCMRALFVKSGSGYQAVEERRPGTRGMMCTMIDAFVPVSTPFTDARPPSQINVQVRAYVVELP
ncbi:MAG TPA: hypothetical protein VIN40_08475 [Candidatus Tyrphobacter sp.]